MPANWLSPADCVDCADHNDLIFPKKYDAASAVLPKLSRLILCDSRLACARFVTNGVSEFMDVFIEEEAPFGFVFFLFVQRYNMINGA
jgi:hypothetical protein